MDNKLNPNILCVDDETINLKLLSSILKPKGYNIIQVTSGKKALETVIKEKIDLILLDILMPEIDGYEVCKTIKKDNIYRKIPIIMITSLDSREDRVKAIEAGAEDFISKPISQTEVLARVKMLLKLKNLHDRLDQSFSLMANIITFGNEWMKTFNTKNFNFMTTFNEMVKQVIKQRPDKINKPKVLVVGIKNKSNKWLWYHYESTFDELYRTILETRIEKMLIFPKIKKTEVVFFNEENINQAPIQALIKELNNRFPNNYSNYISYISNEFCIFAFNYERGVSEYEASALYNIVMQGLFMKLLSTQLSETEEAFEYTIQALVRASEANDINNGQHVVRVGEFCAIISRELGFSEDFIKLIRVQSRIHDVGMIYVPEQILKKKGALTYEEWRTIRQHTINGAKILGENPHLKFARNIAISHHEKWDGSGYPYQLKGDKIPLEGRITSIADHYDTLRIPRQYKDAFDHETAYKIITEGDARSNPSHFDPDILRAFQTKSAEFEETYEKLKDK